MLNNFFCLIIADKGYHQTLVDYLSLSFGNVHFKNLEIIFLLLAENRLIDIEIIYVYLNIIIAQKR